MARKASLSSLLHQQIAIYRGQRDRAQEANNKYYYNGMVCGLKMALDLQQRSNQTVKIEVLGGVAECTKCPAGITVRIIDHDNASA